MAGYKCLWACVTVAGTENSLHSKASSLRREFVYIFVSLKVMSAEICEYTVRDDMEVFKVKMHLIGIYIYFDKHPDYGHFVGCKKKNI